MDQVICLDKRLAIFYSDGSISISPENWSVEKVYKECENINYNAEPKDCAKVAMVKIVVYEILFDPTTMRARQELCSRCHRQTEANWKYCPFCGLDY